MKKIKLDNKHISIAVLILMVIIISMTFHNFIKDSEFKFDSVKLYIENILKVLLPFMIGFGIAFIAEYPIGTIYKKVNIINKKGPKKGRLLAIIVTYILIISLIAFFLKIIIPNIINSVYELGKDIYKFTGELETKEFIELEKFASVNVFLDKINTITDNEFSLEKIINSTIEPIINWIVLLPTMVNTIVFYIYNMVQYLLIIGLGIIISFYYSVEKEYFKLLTIKIIRISFKKKNIDKILEFARTCNSIFKRYIMGKALDSLIIGGIFFFVCIIVGTPYPLLYSIIVGITNMIPYFGPFIGAIPVTFLLLISTNFKTALIVLILLLILQQFDGLYLGPKILGEQTGLKPIGIIFAVIVGGNLFGVLGMFLGVPVFAVISHYFSQYIEEKHKKIE